MKIVENTPGRGQGASGLLAPVCFGGSSNPTDSMTMFLHLFHKVNVIVAGKGLRGIV